MLWSQSDLVKATAGDLIGDWRNDGIAGVSIDSRSIKSDELFVAVKAKRDGHNFINDAIRLGLKVLWLIIFLLTFLEHSFAFGPICTRST